MQKWATVGLAGLALIANPAVAQAESGGAAAPLALAQGRAAPAPVGAPATARGGPRGERPVALGATVTGALAAGDGQLASGEYVDGYRFTARRGQRVRIAITSTEFDTYAILVTPSGRQIENDDGPEGTNARIDEVMPEDGSYRLQVTSFRPGERGAYQLEVAPSNGPPRIANVPAGQRVFALMVGVSDYDGANNDLAFTDKDANELMGALRRRGVLNPASVTLTNARATLPDVRAAFARVAAAAGPDDLFIFFFSGHGIQEETPATAIEPDGLNELLSLRDGNLTDDELGQMFATLRTRMALLVIDACYAGGFARDVVNRPGVMGLFSSEEDLTSLVAEEHQAGGYLSHFLRGAFAGEADTDGDHAISAGELATYLRAGFARPDIGLLEAETRDGQHNYQNLVIERGGVQVNDIVFRLAPPPSFTP